MALAMLIGFANRISVSLFSPGNTLAALLALNFKEVSKPDLRALLMYAALVLLFVTLLVNIAGNLVLQRAQAKFRGMR
jgi:phosphate transport system permease protein